ncbi:MAG: hydrogenase/urease maturation nickel metallochaperone HypA [Candidatus Hodarchaeaceae archaeon]|nr:hydrogenase/urease maturation nickel metallochaperone HypA [Candidatus Hodarchaeaceae archaeon]
MHEVELANRVLSALRSIAIENNADILEVNLQVGELNEPRALRFWLNKLGGDEFRPVKFRIEQVPLTIKCECGYFGGANLPTGVHLSEPELEIPCPKCGRRGVRLTSGREFEIVDVKLRKEVQKDVR